MESVAVMGIQDQGHDGKAVDELSRCCVQTSESACADGAKAAVNAPQA